MMHPISTALYAEDTQLMQLTYSVCPVSMALHAEDTQLMQSTYSVT